MTTDLDAPQPIEVAVVVQRAAWAGIAEELAIGEAAPLGHKHVFATQRFAAGAGKAANVPIIGDFEAADRRQRAGASVHGSPQTYCCARSEKLAIIAACALSTA
jgi:hypothetical protein